MRVKRLREPSEQALLRELAALSRLRFTEYSGGRKRFGITQTATWIFFASSGKAGRIWACITKYHLAQVESRRVLAAKRDQWLTNQDLARLLPDVAGRTIRQHTKRLTELGVLEESQLSGGYRSPHLKTPNRRAVEQLNHAAEAFSGYKPAAFTI